MSNQFYIVFISLTPHQRKTLEHCFRPNKELMSLEMFYCIVFLLGYYHLIVFIFKLHDFFLKFFFSFYSLVHFPEIFYCFSPFYFLCCIIHRGLFTFSSYLLIIISLFIILSLFIIVNNNFTNTNTNTNTNHYFSIFSLFLFLIHNFSLLFEVIHFFLTHFNLLVYITSLLQSIYTEDNPNHKISNLNNHRKKNLRKKQKQVNSCHLNECFFKSSPYNHFD